MFKVTGSGVHWESMVANPLFIASPNFVVSDKYISTDVALLPGVPGPKRTALVTFQKPGGAFRVVRMSTHLSLDSVIVAVQNLFDIRDAEISWIGAGKFGAKILAIGDPSHIPAETLFFDSTTVRLDRLAQDFTVNIDGVTYVGMIIDVAEYSTELELVEGKGSRFNPAEITRAFELSVSMNKLRSSERSLFTVHTAFGEIVAWLVQYVRDNGPLELTATGRFKKDFMARAVQESVGLGHFDKGLGIVGERALKPLIDARDFAIDQGLLVQEGQILHATPLADELGTGSKAVAEATVYIVKTLGKEAPEWYERMYEDVITD